MKIPFSSSILALFILFGVAEQASAQLWSFGFENSDFTDANADPLVFDQSFDGVSNAGSLIDNTYLSATTNDFLYGGDYTVATGFDAQEGSNFGLLSTANNCFGIDATSLGFVLGQEYQVSFYVAALDPSSGSNTFSVSGAFETSDGSTSDFRGTDEQGLAFFNNNFTNPHTFTDPGFSPVSTTTNDKTAMSWELYSTTFTYSASIDRLYFSGFGDDGVGKNIALDDIQIEAVPEPSSAILCLIGAGSWLFFGRRRRHQSA